MTKPESADPVSTANILATDHDARPGVRAGGATSPARSPACANEARPLWRARSLRRAPVLVVAVLVALGMSLLTTACGSDCTPGDASQCGWFCPNNCPAGAQTQTCPILINVTGTVSVWECNIPPQYCNGAPGQNDGPLVGCSCVICQTSEQAALAQAQQILAMQSVSLDPSGPPLQCRGPLATLSSAYDTGPLFTAGECTQGRRQRANPATTAKGGRSRASANTATRGWAWRRCRAGPNAAQD